MKIDWQDLVRVLEKWKSGESPANDVAIAIENLIEAKIAEDKESNHM